MQRFSSLLLALACLALASAQTTPTALTRDSALTLVGNIQKVSAMDSDEFFVYAATYDQIVKTNKNDITDFGLMSLHDSGYRSISTLKIDAEYIYVTAENYDSKPVLLKINKGTMTLVPNTEYVFDVNADNIPYSLVLDGDHVYTGQYTFPGKVLKFSKTNLDLLLSVDLNDHENDIRAMAVDTTGAETVIYALTNTKPGHIVKIDAANMVREAGIELDHGEDNLLAGYCDQEYVFAATNTAPTRIVKIPKADFTYSAHITRQLVTSAQNPDPIDNVIVMDADVQYLYVATYSKPSRIARISKDTLERVGDTLTLESNENYVAAMANSTNSLFVGTDTAPAIVVKVAGFLTPVDCKVSEWSEWGPCSSTCSGGTQERTRTQTVAMQHGGATCPELDDTRDCNSAIVCPTECLGGKVWTTQGTLPHKTCDNPDPQLTQQNLQQCQCPPERPLWHHDEFCTSSTVCDKQVTTECPEEWLTCRFEASKLILARHSRAVIKDYHCRYYSGSRSTANCRCLCATPSSEAVSASV